MILDKYGKPVPLEYRRRRMGFLGGDLIVDHDTAYSVTPPERTYMVGTSPDSTMSQEKS